jgi:hypothetical protein
MDQEDIQNLFEDKYAKTLDMSYEEWQSNGPQTEEQAYARCMEIDRELNATYDEWFDGEGEKKERLQDHREKLKAEYDLLEEIFHLEPNDRSW